MSSQMQRRHGSVREVTFDLFRRLGINKIFGNPGSTEIPMFRDFPEDFSYVLGLQESIVVSMADGYAQTTGNAAVVNLHSAAGLGHALGSVYTAYRNQTPLIITAGQQARSILPFDAYLSAERPTEFPQPYVKYAIEPARAEDVPQAIARAYRIAMQVPRGPVFVSVPIDDWDREAEFLEMREVSSVRHPDPDAIARLSAALNGAANPVIVAGPAIDREGAWESVVKLAESQNIRVFTAPHSNRCSFPENHPLHAGFLPPMREGIVSMLNGHDLILVIGAPAFTYHTEGHGPHIPSGSTLFQITENPGIASWTPSGDAIVCDLKPAVEALLACAEGPLRPAPAPRPEAPRVPASDGLTVEFLMQTIGDLRSPETIILDEAPTSGGARQAYVRNSRPGAFSQGGSGGLGYAMPASVGVALARKTERVICIMGDGSSMYSIQALYSAARERVPVTYIVVNNGSYQALEKFAAVFQIQDLVGTRLPGLDFAGLGNSLGCPAQQVVKAEDLEAVLRAALAADGPNLVEVKVA